MIVFSILPVGTIYASKTVTLTDRAITTIITRALASAIYFLLPVLREIIPIPRSTIIKRGNFPYSDR